MYVACNWPVSLCVMMTRMICFPAETIMYAAFFFPGGSELESVPLSKDNEVVCIGKSSVVVGGEENACVLKFPSNSDAIKFRKELEKLIEKLKKSIFNLRTDPASAEQYFQVSLSAINLCSSTCYCNDC